MSGSKPEWFFALTQKVEMDVASFLQSILERLLLPWHRKAHRINVGIKTFAIINTTRCYNMAGCRQFLKLFLVVTSFLQSFLKLWILHY